MADDESVVGLEDDSADAGDGGDSGGGAEFVPEVAAKPKSNIYTAMLVLSFLAFLTSTIVVGMELYEHYDVQFWVFTKK